MLPLEAVRLSGPASGHKEIDGDESKTQLLRILDQYASTDALAAQTEIAGTQQLAQDPHR
jgi:hypothetical protein